MANDLNKPACLTCGGSGWIGGPSFYEPGEGGEECPDCALTAPVATEQAKAVAEALGLDGEKASLGWILAAIEDLKAAVHDAEEGNLPAGGRIDRAIEACEAHERAGLQGAMAWPEYAAKRSTLEAEYQSALTELSIRAARAHLAASPEAAPAAMEGDPAEAAEILKSLIDNIERGGMYSQESTLGFLSQAYYCLKPANPAATPAAPSVGTASMYAQQHGLAVTTEWMIGWNACLDAIDAAALAQPAPVQAGAVAHLPSDDQVIAAARVAATDPVSDEQISVHLPTWRIFAAALPARSVWAGIDLHPETGDLLERFARALAEKLAAAEKKYGYSNEWKRADWMGECRVKLMEHIAKGDPRDVAAYCAFLWHHGESTASRQGETTDIDPEQFLDGGLADVQDESGVLTYFSRSAVLECIAAALYAAPVQQDTPAPSMVVAWMNPNESFAPDAFIWKADDRHPEYSVPVTRAAISGQKPAEGEKA